VVAYPRRSLTEPPNSAERAGWDHDQSGRRLGDSMADVIEFDRIRRRDRLGGLIPEYQLAA
jgi:hypothetical protein